MACACFAALFLLLAWSGPQVAQTLSTCAPHNSSEMTRRRLEAVRGQILSKLRLADLPEPGQGAVPEEILSLYNASLSWPGWNSDSGSTRCERTGSAEVDEYYAREMRRVTCHSGAGRVDGRILFFTFHCDISGVPTDVDIVTAELRVHKAVNLLAQHNEQRIELYQLLSDQPGLARYLGNRVVNPRDADEWLSFNVSEAVWEWTRFPDQNYGLKLSVHCPCSTFHVANNTILKGLETLEVRLTDAEKEDDRGDLHVLAAAKQSRPYIPHLLLSTLPKEQQTNGGGGRVRRALDEGYCFSGEEKNCCLRKLYINFRQDLGWKWISKPEGYYANYCAGPCPYLWSSDTQYTTVLGLFSTVNPDASATPCCVPEQMESLSIIYYKNKKPLVTCLSNMVVKSCKCR